MLEGPTPREAELLLLFIELLALYELWWGTKGKKASAVMFGKALASAAMSFCRPRPRPQTNHQQRSLLMT